MIEAEYTIEYSDYLAANRLYFRHRRGALALYLTSHLVWAVVSACLVGWFFGTRKQPEVGIALWFYCAVAFVGTIVANLIIRSTRLRRCYRSSYPDASRKNIRLMANDNELSVAVPGRSESRLHWSAIEDTAQNDKVRRLFVSKKRFLIVPRRALNEVQWAEMRALLAARSGRPT